MKYIAIVGSRDFSDYEMMKDRFITIEGGFEKEIKNPSEYCIVSGGARGADKLAEKLAGELNINTLIFNADWETYGKKAGYLRNQQIIEKADLVLAFWNSESKGTKHSIDLAIKHNKPIYIYEYTIGKTRYINNNIIKKPH